MLFGVGELLVELVELVLACLEDVLLEVLLLLEFLGLELHVGHLN